MSNWRKIPALDSSSETNKSVKLLKCIKFVGSFHLKNLKIIRIMTIESEIKCRFFLFFYFQSVQKNSYFGKFMAILSLWPHKNCLFYVEKKLEVNRMIEIVHFPPV